MGNDISVREALEDYFGEEFPDCKNLTGEDYVSKFNTLPSAPVRKIDLTITYRIAKHFNEDHLNVVEAFSSSAELLK